MDMNKLERNNAFSLPKIEEHSKIMAQYGGCSSMAERLSVEQEVAGPTPVSHPVT